MTTLRAALHEYLRDEVDVSISDGRLPTRPMMPHLVQHFVAGRSVQTHTSPASLLARRVQIDAYANNDVEADAIATRLIAALDGYHGLMGDVAIGRSMLLNDLEQAPVVIEKGEIRYRRTLDFEIAFQQTGGTHLGIPAGGDSS